MYKNHFVVSNATVLVTKQRIAEMQLNVHFAPKIMVSNHVLRRKKTKKNALVYAQAVERMDIAQEVRPVQNMFSP